MPRPIRDHFLIELAQHGGEPAVRAWLSPARPLPDALRPIFRAAVCAAFEACPPVGDQALGALALLESVKPVFFPEHRRHWWRLRRAALRALPDYLLPVVTERIRAAVYHERAFPLWKPPITVLGEVIGDDFPRDLHLFLERRGNEDAWRAVITVSPKQLRIQTPPIPLGHLSPRHLRLRGYWRPTADAGVFVLTVVAEHQTYCERLNCPGLPAQLNEFVFHTGFWAASKSWYDDPAEDYRRYPHLGIEHVRCWRYVALGITKPYADVLPLRPEQRPRQFAPLEVEGAELVGLHWNKDSADPGPLIYRATAEHVILSAPDITSYRARLTLAPEKRYVMINYLMWERYAPELSSRWSCDD